MDEPPSTAKEQVLAKLREQASSSDFEAVTTRHFSCLPCLEIYLWPCRLDDPCEWLESVALTDTLDSRLSPPNLNLTEFC